MTGKKLDPKQLKNYLKIRIVLVVAVFFISMVGLYFLNNIVNKDMELVKQKYEQYLKNVEQAKQTTPETTPVTPPSQ